jgi:hypothetical protein
MNKTINNNKNATTAVSRLKQTNATTRGDSTTLLAMEALLMEEQLVKLREDLARDQAQRSNIPKGGIWRSAKKAWESKPGSSQSNTRTGGGNEQKQQQQQSESVRIVKTQSGATPIQPLFRPLDKLQKPHPVPVQPKPYEVISKPIANSDYEELIPTPKTTKNRVLNDLASYYDDEEDESDYGVQTNDRSNFQQALQEWKSGKSENTSDSNQGGGALWGNYDEEANKNAFREALQNWRTGDNDTNIQQSRPSTSSSTSQKAEMEIQTTEVHQLREKEVTLSDTFVQNLKDCVRMTYFDHLESYLLFTEAL